MNENNIRLGEIRLEDSFYEAKISEPNPLYQSKSRRKKGMEQNDGQRESEDLFPIQGDREKYREG